MICIHIQAAFVRTVNYLAERSKECKVEVKGRFMTEDQMEQKGYSETLAI